MVEPRRHRRKGMLRGLGLILFALVASYVAHVVQDVPRADQFQYTYNVVMPWAKGQFTIHNLLVTDGPNDNPHLTYRLFSLLNYELFDLDFRMDAVAGLLALGLLGWLLLGRAADGMAAAPGLLFWPVGTALAALVYSFDTHYAWGIVTFEFVYFLVAIAWVLVADRVMGRDSPRWWPVALCLPPVVFLASTHGSVFVAGFLAALALGAAVERRLLRYWAGVAIVGALFLASFVVMSILARPVGDGPPTNPSLLLPEAVRFVATLFSHAILNRDWVSRTGLADVEALWPVTGALVLALNGCALWLYFRRGLHRRSLLPVTLILSAWVVVAGVLWIRFPVFGEEVAFANRYVRYLNLNLFGCLYALGAAAASPAGDGARWRGPLVGLAIAVLIAQGLQMSVLFNRAPWTIRYYTHIRSALIERLGQPGPVHYNDRQGHFRAAAVNEFLACRKLSFYARRDDPDRYARSVGC